jgi:DNA-binding transcriptional ArsR family regulator
VLEWGAGSLCWLVKGRSLIREPMPAERIAMRLVREILRLIAAEKLSVREAARRTGKAPSTVRATLGPGGF